MEIYEPTASGAHVSTTVADNTTVTTDAAPAGARGLLLSAKSKAVYVTFDGTTPSSTNGLYFPAETMPVFIPVIPTGGSIKWISADVAGSTVDILWLR